MIKEWFVLPTSAAAVARSEEVSLEMGYPRPSTETERATDPRSHPDGRGAVAVVDDLWSWVAEAKIDMKTLLTPSEIAGLHNMAYMVADGWFPTIPGPG